MRTLHWIVAATLGLALVACGDEDEGFNWNDDLASGDGNIGIEGGGGAGQGGGLVQRVDRECPPRDAAGVTYLEEDPAVCEVLTLRCSGGELPFRTLCGCGCAQRAAWCPDTSDPGVREQGRTPAACAATPPLCLPGEEAYDDECGCGCVAGDGPVCPVDNLFAQQRQRFGEGEICDFVVACLDLAPNADQLDAVMTAFPSMQCAAVEHPSCGATQAWACTTPLGVLSAADVEAACDLAGVSGISPVGCSSIP